MSYRVSIDDYEPSHLEPLFELLATYFPSDDRLLTQAYSRWLYADNPFGLARMVRVTTGDRWVGFMAMIPAEVVHHSASMRAYYVVNVLVHPQHLGKHLFGRMIAVAKEFAATVHAALMGHPNDMAIRSWQRAKMQFHQPLRPTWILPQLFLRGMERNVVRHLDVASPLWSALTFQRQAGNQWLVRISPEFLTWRFLAHPTNHYHVHWLRLNGEPIGLQVLKPIRHGVQLLMDSFILDSHAGRARCGLPFLTVAMRPRQGISPLLGGFFPVPLRKQIPFFFTHHALRIETQQVIALGLTPSDF